MKIPPELALKQPAREVDDVLQIIEQITAAHAAAQQSSKRTTGDLSDTANKILARMAQKLAALATATWKMQRRIFDQETAEARDSLDSSDTRKLARDVESMLNTLAEIGIKIRDRTGQSFDYGMPEKVVDAKPAPGITKERVVETLKPTITWSTDYWKDTMIQKGEVIIHTPEA
jgi:molecular chaperone GrpE (heat shock protein)